MVYKPRYKKQPWEADERTMAQHNRYLGEVMRGHYPDDAVYDLRTMHKEMSFDKGYQVTFVRGGTSYTAKEYANVVNDFLRSSIGHWTYISKFNGYPEITFRVNSAREAFRLARKYGQTSVFDWAKKEDVKVPERRKR